VFSGAEACATKECLMRKSADARHQANLDCGAGSPGVCDRQPGARALPMPCDRADLPAVILEQPAAMAFSDA
jgi:hypothetical protein